MATIPIAEALRERLSLAALQRGESLDAFVQCALEDYLRELETEDETHLDTENKSTSGSVRYDWQQQLSALAEAAHAEYVAHGGQPLDWSGLEQEIADRRGGYFEGEA